MQLSSRSCLLPGSGQLHNTLWSWFRFLGSLTPLFHVCSLGSPPSRRVEHEPLLPALISGEPRLSTSSSFWSSSSTPQHPLGGTMNTQWSL